MTILPSLLVVLILLTVAQSFQFQRWTSHQVAMPKLKSNFQFAQIIFASSMAFLPASLSFVAAPAVVYAGEAGSKTDKTFELCVSKCVFSETRPPPIGSSTDRLEAKDRVSIISDCRKSCAKTKAQLLVGEPKKAKSSSEETAPSQ